MRSKSLSALPYPVRAGLARLGEDIRTARIKRRITAQSLAERSFISPVTLGKVERGDPAVRLGIYATVLFMLGLHERLFGVAEGSDDQLGLMLEEKRLAKRVRHSRKRPF